MDDAIFTSHICNKGIFDIREKAASCACHFYIGLVTNFAFNYLFIFGNFGFPELGISGVAFFTLTSVAMMLSGLLYIHFSDLKKKKTSKIFLFLILKFLKIFSNLVGRYA